MCQCLSGEYLLVFPYTIRIQNIYVFIMKYSIHGWLISLLLLTSIKYLLQQSYQQYSIISSLMVSCGLRKFIFGFNGVEFTHDALTKYQAMTCEFNIHHFCIKNKPSYSLWASSDLFLFVRFHRFL